MTDFQTLVQEIVDATIAANADTVAAWVEGTPKSWGYLAGRAVGSAHRRLDRPLTDEERRLVWAMLWGRLQELRHADISSENR